MVTRIHPEQLGRRVWISQPPGSLRCWKVNKHGAFSIPRKTLGLKPNDQGCHRETWLHLPFVDLNSKWSREAYYNGNIRLKERPARSEDVAQKRSICEILSDHSHSSYCVRWQSP